VLSLPFRGHDENAESSNRGAFIETQELIARHSDDIKEALDLPKNRIWNHHEIQNQFIQVIADNTLLKILLMAKDAVFWSFGADGAQDRRKKEHLSISIRFVNKCEEKYQVS
jgi:hypothetical protein